jgi:hypothetical protein
MRTRLRGGIPPLFQLVGLAAVALGVGLVFLPAGIVVAGAGLFTIGFVLDQRPSG